MLRCSEKTQKTVAKVFNVGNVSNLLWPDNPRAQQVRKLILPLMQNGIEKYIGNIQTDMHLLIIDENVFPIALQRCCNSDSLIASPSTLYFDVARNVIGDFKNAFLKYVCLAVLGFSRPLFCKCQFDKVAFVNGWPFSTTLYPELSLGQLTEIRNVLLREFPLHAIVFRTVDTLAHEEFPYLLKRLGFRLIYARPVYSMIPGSPEIKLTASLKKDLRQIRKTSYDIVGVEELEERHIERLYQLYHQLYIEKHSPHNPDYTIEFFRLLVKERILPMIALRKNGEIDGFLGILEDDRILTSPFLGYDLKAPKELALYRILEALLYKRAKENRVVLNNSAGVGYFKRSRGCSIRMEYIAVYDKHLPLSRRIPWVLLQHANRIAIPLMMKYDS